MTGCDDDHATTKERDEVTKYAVLRTDDWKLQEAVDPPEDDPIATADHPPLAWYAEYVQNTANSSRMVRISGHLESLSQARDELERVGFSFVDVDVDGWQAVGSAASGGSPAMILLENVGGTIIGLSYEVGLDELAGLGADIEAVDEATWVEAGGVIG
jgi:hypothetical protein